ncbi:hypothetical protein J2X47_002820 [Sphingomonas sp. BE270]|jgi:hypothetical protein|uniref:hypothetical protein n=1 Tax=unclassified Sphingomonas TaxID=196159 RepID=UPI0012E028A4|nr:MULTISPECIES: hypothetical protein [unclassified Sphingomonas]MDR7258630.1 hypothetical protein [Sphingomonas sp. BE270]
MRYLAMTASLGMVLGGCAPPSKPVGCPDPAAVAPASIGGASYVAGLTGRLSGPDRENVIAEAIAEIHRADPGMSADAITNVLIAADCPVAAAKPDHTESADRQRIGQFRAQVDQLLGS